MKRKIPDSLLTLACCGALLTSACLGQIGGELDPVNTPGAANDGDGDGDSPGDVPGVDDVPEGSVPRAPTADEPALGRRMARRLTGEQFRNSLVAIFQDQNVPEGDVLTDPAVFGFHVDARAAVVRDLGAQQLMSYAERVASWAVANKLNQISPCQSNDPACRRQFIQSFGRKMFRRPLSTEQVDAYERLMATEGSFNDGVATALTAMIQSPNFLYRREIGTPAGNGKEAQLNAYEIATELAFLITNTTPDEALLRAAEQGTLNTPEALAREVDRLLATEAAKRTLAEFVGGWLHIEDLPMRVKTNEAAANFTPAVRQAMLGETRALFNQVFQAGGTVDDLLGADFTYVNSTLAAYYGLGGGNGETFTRVTLPAGRRAPGILGHGSFLTRHALAEQSSPVQRGYTIRKRLMCETIAPPPAGIDTNIRPPSETSTTREKYKEHSTNATCAGCHALMDPIGFTFENFDELGRFRERQNNAPIDATGAVTANTAMGPGHVEVPGGEVALSGHQDLIEFLKGSDAVEDCFARFLTYFAYGVDGVASRAVAERGRADGGALKDYLMAAVAAPHFTRRSMTE